MAELYREEIVRVDLGSPLRRYSVGKVLATGDDRANRFGAEVFRRGAAVSLDGGKVNGYFIPPEGEALLLDGSATGNTAYVELHGACYAQEGRFSLAVKATADGVTTTLCVFDGWIVATATDEVRDPGGIVPSLDDILELIADMEQATEEAEAAAAAANAVASKVARIDEQSGTMGYRRIALTIPAGEISQTYSLGTLEGTWTGVFVRCVAEAGVIASYNLTLKQESSTLFVGGLYSGEQFSEFSKGVTDPAATFSLTLSAVQDQDKTVEVTVVMLSDSSLAALLFARTDTDAALAKAGRPADAYATGVRIDALARSSADVVVVPASGAVINVQDACEGRAFPALSILGQTWQDSTPTPDSPAELVSVTSPTVSVLGKNLFDKDTVQFVTGSFLNASGAVESNASYAYSETYIPVAPGASYVFSGQIVEGAYNTVAFYDRKKAFISRFSPGAPDKNSAFTTPANCYFIRFNASPSLDVNTIQLETGSVATAYESCLPQRIQAAYTLRGVPVASGGNYTDENGQQWICDEVDLMRGKYIQRIGSAVMSSGVGWNKTGKAVDRYYRQISYALPGIDLTRYEAILCSHFVHAAAAETIGLCTTSASAIGFAFAAKGASTSDTWSAWLDANEVKVYYPLATPVETDLTADEVAAFLQLRSPYGAMTVLNDAGAGMHVSYVADTKLYIDQKMAAIAQAVLNM